MNPEHRDLIIGSAIVADPRSTIPSGTALVVALARAGALGVLDIACPDDLGGALAAVAARTAEPFAIRPGAELAAVGIESERLLDAVTTIVLDAGVVRGLGGPGALADTVGRWDGRRVLVEVTSADDARAAVAAGADGLIAKGSESGGSIGDTETFVLLQQTVDLGVPVWARGGIGRHTAAAAVATGARGVFLDGQLALVRESSLPAATRAAIGAMDGSETRVIAGHRVYTRPDLAVAARSATEPAHRIVAALGPDIRRDLVPIGQDASLADDLAIRFKTAGGVVTAVRAAIADHLAAADAHEPLRPGGGIAESHGTRYPIAQGPMTRVSDRAAFAAAVANGGGLPFLALALLPGSEVEALLQETAELLGDRPWGVGVLGFVPPELREEQLAVVQRIRPPVALIAGGRPSQAAPLEAAGIATYLHVPSPGLLDRFVKDGARRFVFEGRECGGHVGPRASFALWDAQVERLLAVPDPENLHVLFAGGIHDARSAAAVAAVGAPLAARGAHLGVLMGTAYLFTKEAVTTGAIAPAFQDTALTCERTVLLETSPGHATRCVETDYVRVFQDTKAALEANGVGTKEMWAELETLNLGRLRVASKALTRGDDGLVEVDEETQRRDGMYMIGQVAALRDQVTTVADLHREVSDGATSWVHQLAATANLSVREPDRVPPPLDIAIVGMASLFPGSVSADEFWSMILAGANAITEVPPERWEPELYFDPDSTTVGAGHKTPSKWGGFLAAVGFDPLAYGIPPASLAAVEPVQLLSLEIASRALADAGYADREFDRSRASVVFGAENGNDLSGAYGMRAMLPQLIGDLPPELDRFLPTLTEDSFPGVLTNVIAGRIANRLDLGGVNFTVDAACAASLAALDAACKELLAGNSDLVLCGGADVHNGINDFLLFSSVHALSPTGQCKTFDAAADGIALGEGIACVVLKRRVDAERDGDRIYAVIDAIAGSSDGRHLGLTAPRKEGQQRALERAYAQARRSPADLGLVEAHGTGTVVGDKTELATLTEVFADHDATVGSCVLGSVKSQIGHTKCAAGLAGLIKTAKALYHGVLPPTGNLTEPNAAYDAVSSPFRFLDRPRPWVGADRHAGVSAFGFGGANFHAVLSSYDGDDGPTHGVDMWPAELFLVRAADVDTAGERLGQLSTLVDAIVATDPASERHRLRDLAATVSGEGSGPVQVAIVATDLADLADKLVVARSGTGRRDGVFLRDDVPTEVQRRTDPAASLAFVYPGQGSQRTGMLADLFITFPRLRGLLDLASPWLDTLYPAAAFTPAERSAQTAALTDTRVAQPVLGLCGLALTDLLAAAGVRPDVAAGHSYGELVALASAGAFDAGTLLDISRARGEAIVAAAAELGEEPGTMAAVSASLDTVATIVERHPGVVIANHNGPSQVVVSGATAAVAALVADLEAEGIAAKQLDVACAFHSPLLNGAHDRLAARLADAAVATLQFPVYANTTASPYPPDAEGIRQHLRDQVTGSVRFVDEVEAMYAAGSRVFVEAGPGRVLTQLIGKILGDRPHRAIACDSSGESGVRRFLLALAELAVIGVEVQTDILFEGRATPVALADLPVRAPGWTLDGHLVRTATGAVVPGSLQPANEIPALAIGAPTSPDRDAAVLEYLRGIREVVAAERDVMLHYLGASAETIGASSVAPVAHSPGADGFATPNAPLEVVEAGELAGPASAPAGVRVRGDDLLAVVLQIVADRTGYPTDMLDPDLDLEADLSIDSIKRIEIIGELAERIGLDAMGDDGIDDAMVEELAQLKTLREIVAWIDDLDLGPDVATAHAGPEAIDVRGGADDPRPEQRAGADPDDESGRHPVPERAVRQVFRTIDLDPPTGPIRRLEGRRLVVADDGRGVAPLLVEHLVTLGATATIVTADGPPGPDDLAVLTTADSLVWLRGLHPDTPSTPERFDARAAFAWWQPAVLGATTTLVTATSGGGSFATDPGSGGVGLGLGAMAKTVARELPGVTVRAVDLDPATDPDLLAACLLAEIDDTDAPVEVGYDGPQRVTRIVVAEALGQPSTERSSDSGEPPRVPLGADSVVLLTGGARGITARTAIALARRHGCTVELAGRSPLPTEPEPDTVAAAADRTSLRRVLLEAGDFTTPAAIEAECSRLLAAREIRTTLATLAETGVRTTYHCVDVCDAAALASVVADVRARHGRLDLVVHGAGVLDDRFLRDKTANGFSRVFATKVDAARTLLAHTTDDTVVVFFGSVSGVFGNRGQIDYSAANAALDELAVTADRISPGRALTVDWGPWAGTGMVSAELEREYERRGIGLIDPDDGVAALLDELAAPRGTAQVIVLRADAGALAPEMGRWAPALEGARP